MLQSPLSLRLTAQGADRFVEDIARDLEFTKTARGGYESATFTLPEWVSTGDPALSAEARCRIYDGRNANTVFEGYQSQPGKRREDAQGDTWQMTVTGAQSILADQNLPYIAIVGLEDFQQRSKATVGATGSISTVPTNEDVPAVVVQFPSGQPVASGANAAMTFTGLRDTGQKIGGFSFSVVSGQSATTGNYQTQSYVANAAGASDIVHSTDMSGADVAASTASAGGSAFGVNRDALTLRLHHSGSDTNVTSDNVWSAFHDVWVRALLKGIDGANISGAFTYSDPFVLAHQVVIDALWRFTTMVNVAGASIDATFAHHIDQLSYTDGVRMSELLDALALFEPDMIWQVGPSNAAGQHSFTLRRYDTTPRYMVTTRDGWTESNEAQVANRLTVYWTDKHGKEQHKTFSAAGTTPGLDQWGRVRDADEVHLGAEVGSAAAADRVGTAYLAELANVAHAGTLTVARKVLDLYTGRSVAPWEIEPGYLVQVTDLDERFPMPTMTFKDGDQSADLTLGRPAFSTDELTNLLARQRTHRGGASLPTIRR